MLTVIPMVVTALPRVWGLSLDLGPTWPLATPCTLPVHRNIMNNKVFYQHPNLMRALGMHETVMEVMVNVLGGGGESKVRGLWGPRSSGQGGSRGQALTTGPLCLPRRSASPRW